MARFEGDPYVFHPDHAARDQSYASLEEWMEAEGMDEVFQQQEPDKSDYGLKRLGNVRQALWFKHMETLSADEQVALEMGDHPSLSWDREEEARAYVERFAAEYKHVNAIEEVNLGFYHGRRLVISVVVSAKVKGLPAYYHGFEVKVAQPA